MRKATHMIAAVAGLSLAATATAAPIALVNGDFQTGDNWVSTGPTGAHPATEITGWMSNYDSAPGDGQYMEILGEDGGSDRHFMFKSHGEAHYIQQGLGVVGADDQYIVDLDYGYRSHHSSDGDITLRVSLWDTTNDVEIAGSDLLVADPNPGDPAGIAGSNNPASHASLVFNIDAGALAGNDIAVRITNASEEGPTGGSWRKTAYIDNVAVEVPEPASFALLALAGVAIAGRRK